MKHPVTKKQLDFYNQNRNELIEKYLISFPFRIDPDAVRDLFAPVGYTRKNAPEFQEVCKLLTNDIFSNVLSRNIFTRKKVIFAAGLPGTGKSIHLNKFAFKELVYDGTITNDRKFIESVKATLDMDFSVRVFIYHADPVVAFKRNLVRGDTLMRYVSISHYEKVADSINRRSEILQKHFNQKVKFLNFEHTNFEGKLRKFSKIIIDRNELERIAKGHNFADNKELQKVIG